jgi:hypothetical protein
LADDDRRLGFTRARDLAVVAGVALVVGYVVVRIAYGALPVFPRLAGISAAVLGLGEAVAGFNIRARLRAGRPAQGGADHPRSTLWGELKPLPPLVGARSLMVAKASSLAGAGLTGLWSGLLLYTAPLAGSVSAAGRDSITAVIGILCALVLTGGALWLERCCVQPEAGDDDRDQRRRSGPGGSGLGPA